MNSSSYELLITNDRNVLSSFNSIKFSCKETPWGGEVVKIFLSHWHWELVLWLGMMLSPVLLGFVWFYTLSAITIL